jgi:hypothetical protein
MSALALAAAAPFALLGIHLLRIARRSGAVPDRLLSAFFLLSALGVPPRIAAIDLATAGAGTNLLGFWLTTAANLSIGTGIVCLAAFAWQVFRPTKAWARNVVIGCGLAIAAATAAGTTSLGAAGGSAPQAIAFNFIGALVLVWAFVECVVYYQRMRRRRTVGLADPLVTNRFFLWSVWTGTIGLNALFTTGLRVAVWSSGAGAVMAAGGDPGGDWLAWIRLAKGLVLIIAPTALVSVWLSFTPPAAYRRWLGQTDGESTPAATESA